jgi:hypothetical protein
MHMKRWLIAAAVAGTAACTSLPDTSGYTEATLQLGQSVSGAGGALKSELARTAPLIEDPSQRESIQSAATRFDEAWAATVESLAAMGRYAEAVEELTAAGNQGSQSAQQLSQSVLALAGAVGFVPGAAVAGVATETFQLLNSAIASVRASRSLGRSLAAADPIIQDIGGRVGEQVALARQTFIALVSQQRAGLDFTYSDVKDLEAELRRQEMVAATRALTPGASGEAQPDLMRVRDARAVLAPRLTEYQSATTDLSARERAGLALFDATDAALLTWTDSHGRMVTAVRERRPVSFQSLLSAGQEIRGLVQRWRGL